MHDLDHILDNNRKWAESIQQSNPELFEQLAAGQSPDYLWIGCSDSRVPANTVTGLQPGNLFVHRNIANQVYPDDLNAISVMEYAVHVLKIKHILVCGHYGCGGVKAATDHQSHGAIDHWLSEIRNIYYRNREELERHDEEQRLNRLCELNVISQVNQVARTPIVRKAWAAGQSLRVHGIIYNLEDGRLNDLKVSKTGNEASEDIYRVQ